MANNRELSQFASTVGHDGGNIGFGTDSPRNNAKLDVHNPTASGVYINYDGKSNTEYGLRIESNAAGGNFESDFANGTTALLDLYANSSTVTGGDLLVARTQSSTPVLLVKGNGNIGIGTDNPSKPLQIHDDSSPSVLITGSAPQVRLNSLAADGSDNDRAIFGLATSGGHFFSSASAGDACLRTTDGGDLLFGEGTTERVRIDSVGRLLIGRTTQLQSSSERLTIDSGMSIFRLNGTSTAALYLRNEDSTASTNHPYLIFTDGSGNRGGIGIRNDSSSLWISGQNGIAFRTSGTAPGTTERLRITSDGKVGVGINAPEYSLDLGESSSTIRLVSENNGTAIRIGAGGGSNDVSLIRVDGNSNVGSQGESNDSNYGFSLKYMGSRSSNLNALSVFSDNQTGTQVEAVTILQDGKIGVKNTSPDGVGIDVTSSRSTNYSATTDQRSLAHIIARNGSDAANRFSSISLVNGGGTQAEASINLIQAGNYIGHLAFKMRSGASSWAERLRILSSGAVKATKGFLTGANNGAGMIELASSSGSTVIDTGISINASNGGGAMMVLASRNTSDGTNTAAGMYLLDFRYSGNNVPGVTFIGGDNICTFSKTAGNNLSVTCSSGNWSVGAFFGGYGIGNQLT